MILMTIGTYPWQNQLEFVASSYCGNIFTVLKNIVGQGANLPADMQIQSATIRR